MRHVESRIQSAAVRWFRLQYPQFARLLACNANGGYRNPVTAAVMKAEGVMPGVSDLTLYVPSGCYHGLCIEMKTPKGRQQPTQKLWQEAVEAMGYKYVICRSVEEFVSVIRAYFAEKA